MTEPLSEEQQRELRAELERQRDGLNAELRRELAASESEHHAELAGQVGDLEDQALADLLVDEALAGVHRHIRELREIDAALARMERGTFGVCADCEEPIAYERLQAYPTAERCIDCQARFERTHAQEGHPTL